MRVGVRYTLAMTHWRAVLFGLLVSPPLWAVEPAWHDVDAGTRAGLRGLSLAGERVIWIGGSEGTLRRSTDAGLTWASVAPPDTQALDFRDVEARDARRALALSVGPGSASRLFVTHDGGRTWTTAWRHATHAPSSTAWLSGTRDGGWPSATRSTAA